MGDGAMGCSDGRCCTVTDIRIDLPFLLPPLTANQRLHWAKKAEITRDVRATVATLARHHKIPRAERITVTLHYRPQQNRRRDRHNLYPTVKAAVDGLVDAGIVPDDDTEHVSTPEPVIHTAVLTGRQTLWLELHYPAAGVDHEK